MKIYKKTKSFCPQCQAVLDTDIIEKNGSMWMKKICPQDGPFEIKIAKYAWFYKGLHDYHNILFNNDYYEKNDPTKIYTTSITSKCNLSCPICFADTRQQEPESPSITFFKHELGKLKNKKKDIHFSGGEPTMREDLPQLIKMVRESGNLPSVFTNGVKIAQSFEYLKLLKKGGLNAVYLWMDTVKKPEIYKKLRGENFIDLKIKAIENIKKLNIPLRIIAVILKDINESEIGDLMEFAKKERGIDYLYFRGYSYLGQCNFTPNQEFLPDELFESVTNQCRNLFTLEDIYYYQKLLLTLRAITKRAPLCHQVSALLIPRKKEKFLHHIFRSNKFSAVLKEFEKIWQENPGKAKKYLLVKCLPKVLTTPDLYYFFQTAKKAMFGSYDSSSSSKYYVLLMAAINNIATFDLENIQQTCNNRSFNCGVENSVPRCYEMLDLYRKKR